MKECDMLMASSPEFSVRVNQIRNTYRLFDNLEAQKEVDTNVAWKKVSRKIKQTNTRRLVWNFTRNVAAVLLPLFLIFQYAVQPQLEGAPVIETITLSSAPGVITKAILPDGSKVWLNSQSELAYPRQFTNNERTVHLNGEAYFKVVSDNENSFNVVTPDKTVVSAYGTEFNVDAYKKDAQQTVTLANGNVYVSLQNQSQKTTLAPNQKAIIHPEINKLDVMEADVYVETAWKDGKMVFRRENIQQIAERISKKFGVTINVEGNTTNDYEFTATFVDESLEDILELLKLSSAIDYSISYPKKLPDNSYTQRVVTIKCI